MKEHNKILEEIKNNIEVFEWQDLYDIRTEASKMTEEYYIIFNNIDEITSINDNVYYVQVFASRENRKLLFITKKMFEKIDKYIMYIHRYGKEKVESFVQCLHELYPGFNFFDLSWIFKTRISGCDHY
jgi:hypothetical protein